MVVRRLTYTFGLAIVLCFLLGLAAYAASAVLNWLPQGPAYDAQSYAEAWLDLDGNGEVSGAEPPLPGVCVWSGLAASSYEDEPLLGLCNHPSHLTGEDGTWPGDFYPGSRGDDIFIFSRAPEGMLPTTPQIIRGSHAVFGFAQAEVLPANVVVDVDVLAADYIESELAEVNRGIFLQRAALGLTLLAILALAWFLSTRIVRSA